MRKNKPMKDPEGSSEGHKEIYSWWDFTKNTLQGLCLGQNFTDPNFLLLGP